MVRVFITLILNLIIFSNVYASQSTITESEGYSCMGEDKSRKQTEQAAMADAKRKAVEYSLTYLKTETQVKDFELQKDLIEAYSNASVKVIQEIERKWYKDESAGECFKVKIKAEVVPDEKAIEMFSKSKQVLDGPSGPLSIKVWTDKREYKQGEKIKVYIKGNKPYYARVVYKDASGKFVQILPNPHRSSSYFNGGVIYEIPSGEDRFELEVSPPFGEENIIVYASTSQLGDIDIEPASGIYEIKTKDTNIGNKTRGLMLKEKGANTTQKTSAEFSESNVILKTEK